MAEDAEFLRCILSRPCEKHNEAEYDEIYDDDDYDGFMDPWQIVHDAVKESIEQRMKRRNAKKTRYLSGLYTLEELYANRALPPGIPTIRHHDEVLSDLLNYSREFERQFAIICPVLVGFDFEKHGICVAGSAVGRLVTMGDVGDIELFDDLMEDYNSFDLFLVGHSSEIAACQAIEALLSHITDTWPRISDRYDEMVETRVYRTQDRITFWFMNEHKTIRVVLRRYTTIADVLDEFDDVGSSAFLWDGVSVWMTTMGKLAAEWGVNVLNPRNRRAGLECRLAFAFDSGFDIVVPGLDMAQMLTKNTSGVLPYLKLKHKMLAVKGCVCCWTSHKISSDNPRRNKHPNDPYWWPVGKASSVIPERMLQSTDLWML